MASKKALLAYAMLHAAVEEGATSPVHALVPLIERTLTDLAGSTIGLSAVQKAILKEWGLEIPVNIIRYCMGRPHLRDKYTYIADQNQYTIRKNVAGSRESSDIEAFVANEYSVVVKSITLTAMRESKIALSADEIVFRWLDSVSDAHVSAMRPTAPLNNEDEECNRIVVLCMNSEPGAQKFREAITDIALGDILYKSILYASQYETLGEVAQDSSKKMSGVKLFLDTGLVLRLLGYMDQERYIAAQELVQMAKATGCSLSIFDHTIQEAKDGLTAVANRLYSGSGAYGPLVNWAVSSGLGKSDVLEEASLLEEKVTALGIAIETPPPVTSELSIAELQLDYEIEVGVRQDNPLARARDVQSISAIYRLRDGVPQKFETCRAMFVTNNKSLADSVTRFFNREFKAEKADPGIQLCMTDVTVTTRLWTKLPTRAGAAPRQQILSRSMSYLRPNGKLRENFLLKLDRLVRDGKLSDESAALVRLTNFADQILAAEFDAYATTITDTQAVDVIKSALVSVNAKVNTRAAQMAAAKTASEVSEIRRQTEIEINAIREEAVRKTVQLNKLEVSNEKLIFELEALNRSQSDGIKSLRSEERRYLRFRWVCGAGLLVSMFAYVGLTMYIGLNPSAALAKGLAPWVGGLGAIFAVASFVPKNYVELAFRWIMRVFSSVKT